MTWPSRRASAPPRCTGTFPTRDQLIEAVYHADAQKLADARRTNFAPPTCRPLLPCVEWMLVFVDYVAAKQIIMPVLEQRRGRFGEALPGIE